MVEVRELRIGNFILHDDKICEVCAIYSNGLMDISPIDSYIVKERNNILIEPIPITEELLSRCGFEKREIVNVDTEHQYIYHHKEFGFISCNFAYCINDTNDYSEYDNVLELSLPLKHLHQLQNIYFDLTGKELEVNL